MLRGTKVVLRPVEERDLPLLARWRNDPENRKAFFSPFLVNPGAQKQWYEGVLRDGQRVMFMIESMEGETVGTIGLDGIDWRNQQAQIGQFLLEAEQRQHGYAEDAARVLLQYAFEELNLHRLQAEVYGWNRPVIEWIKFYGFREEGVLREAVFSGGRFQDKVILGLLRADWRGSQRRGSEQSRV
jgi:RimJ/RimL family protein N-acetyltransferase